MKPPSYGMLILASAFSSVLLAQTGLAGSAPSAKESLIRAWHLVRIEAPGPDGKIVSVPPPEGMLIYTRDGHMSVQLMYQKPVNPQSDQYVLDGYEASFGSYDVNEGTHMLTRHVRGSITREMLVGKDLPRLFELTRDGHLVIKSAHAEEHWAVIWEHY